MAEDNRGITVQTCPLIFIRDARKRAGRISAPFLYFGVLFIAVGLFPALFPVGGPHPAPAGSAPELLLIGGMALILFLPGYGPVRVMLARQRADTWLCLDGTGLTLLTNGRRRSWRWSEISDMRFDRRFSLRAGFGMVRTRAVLWLPRPPAPVRFPVPRPLSLLFMRNVLVIADDYLTPIGEIADDLTAFWTRARATTKDPSEPDAAPPPPPDTLPILFAGRRSAWPAALGARVAAGMTIVAAIAAVLFVLFNIGQIGNGMPSPPFAYWWPGLIGATCGITVFIGISIRAWGADANAILMSSDGLLLVTAGRRRQWIWRDIFDSRLERGTTFDETGSAHSVGIHIAAGHHGNAPGGKRHGTLVEFVIEDAYESPIEDIAAAIDRWRERDKAAATLLAPNGT